MDVGIKKIEDLKDFASYLQWLSTSMLDEFSKTRMRVSDVYNNWHDDESLRFLEEFTVSMEQINRIAEQMDAYSRYVQKKYEILEMYKSASM